MAKIPAWVAKWGPLLAVTTLFAFVYLRGEGAGGLTGEKPDFTLPRLGGGELTLSKLGGRIRIVDFWATWCGPCHMMTPHFVALQDKYQARGVVVIGVALDDQDAVREYAERNGINYPIVFGDEAVPAQFGGIRGIPTTFILDRSGRITNRHVGFRPIQILQADIDGLI